jgi:hypothetical protein
LHENKWVDGVGAFLTGAEVDAIFAGDLPQGPGPGAIGLDLGLSKDRSVLSVVRRDPSGLVVVEGLTTWAGQHGEKVDLTAVEDEVAALAAKIGAPIVLDPWQAVLMAQRLRARGLPVIEYAFTGDGRRKLFGSMLDLIRNGRLRSRPHDDLRRELLGLEVTQTASGWRVDHRTGRHDDHVVAVALAARRVAAVSAIPRTVAEEEARRPEGQIEKFQRERHEWETTKVPNLLKLIKSKVTAPIAARVEAEMEKMLKARTPEDAVYRQLRETFYDIVGWRRLIDTDFMNEYDAEDRLNKMLDEGEAA